MAPPSRKHRSLFGEILDWMLAPLLLLWPLSVLLTWLVAQGLANQPFDRELGAKVRYLARQVEFRSASNGRTEATFDAPERTWRSPDDSDVVYYQVLGSRGERLAGDKPIPLPADEDHALPGEVRFRDESIGPIEVRVGYMWVPGLRAQQLDDAARAGGRDARQALAARPPRSSRA